MPAVEYRRHIQWLRARADEVRAASKNIGATEQKATALREIAENYERSARQLEDVVERNPVEDAEA